MRVYGTASWNQPFVVQPDGELVAGLHEEGALLLVPPPPLSVAALFAEDDAALGAERALLQRRKFCEALHTDLRRKRISPAAKLTY